MSWWAYMQVDTGGEYPATVEEIRNVTYNNGRIFAALSVFPKDLEGKSGAELVPVFSKALEDAAKPEREAELLKLEPDNHWGGLDDVRDFLQKALEACRKHPKAVIHFS